VFELLIEFA